jgi:hypothetical protein
VISYRVMLAAAGILLAALLAAFVPLTMASHDLDQSADATTPVMALALAAVGTVVASRLPRNPIGWLLCGSGLATLLLADAELYVVLEYRIDHGMLPLGPAAAFWVYALWPLAFLIGTPVLVLFPDGRLPTRLSRWSMRVYLATSTLWLAGQVVGGIDAIAGHQIHIDVSASVTNNAAGLAHRRGRGPAHRIGDLAGSDGLGRLRRAGRADHLPAGHRGVPGQHGRGHPEVPAV